MAARVGGGPRRAAIKLDQSLNCSLQPSDILLLGFDLTNGFNAQWWGIGGRGFQLPDALAGQFDDLLKLLFPESGHGCNAHARLIGFSVVSIG